MSVRTALAITFVAAVTMWSFANNPACAQEVQSKPGDFEITSIRLLTRQAPKYSGGNADLGGEVPASNKPWLRIEVEFTSKLDWADDVQLKYHVLMGKGKGAKLFVGEVTLVNIAKGTKHYAAMFLHPNTLDRFGGGGRVEAVAVVLSHQNRPLSIESEPKTKERWWERYSPTPGFLLSPRDTPWSVIAYQRFEAEKTSH